MYEWQKENLGEEDTEGWLWPREAHREGGAGEGCIHVRTRRFGTIFFGGAVQFGLHMVARSIPWWTWDGLYDGTQRRKREWEHQTGCQIGGRALKGAFPLR